MPLEKITPKVISLYIGLIVIFIAIIVFTEVLTVQLNTIELSMILRDTMKSSCKFFSQESYMLKAEEGTSAVRGNAYPILAKDGAMVVSGLFYDRDSYRKLLVDSPDADMLLNKCHEVIDGSNAAKNNSYRMLKSIINGEDDYLRYGITPTNLGFTYLDSETVSKIFRWKLTNKLTSNSINRENPQQRNTILYDNKSGQHYIKWRNFRIYLDGPTPPQVSNLSLEILHLMEGSDVSEDWFKFSEYTGLTQNYLTNASIDGDDIRSYKIVYDVKWKLDIGYEGILPLALVLNTLDLVPSAGANANGWNFQNNQFRISNETKLSVLVGNESNEEISRTTWDTGDIASPNYENIGSLWVADRTRNIGLTQNYYYTIVH